MSDCSSCANYKCKYIRRKYSGKFVMLKYIDEKNNSLRYSWRNPETGFVFRWLFGEVQHMQIEEYQDFIRDELFVQKFFEVIETE